jgi:hypothetical protein
LRVQKPYARMQTSASTTFSPSDTILPRYFFSTKGLEPVEHDLTVAKSALDKIRIVPNPYLGYSTYETQANDAEVKITNLPNTCTIKIYTLDGVLVRTIQRAISVDPVKQALGIAKDSVELSDGYNLNDNTGSTNLDNSVQWNLTNESNIPVSSGIYLFDIQAPGIGHKILKWFGAVRPTDVSNF